MTNRTTAVAARAALAAILAAFSGCQCPFTNRAKPPIITKQPKGGIVIVGQPFSLSIKAKNVGIEKGQPIGYQWQRNGANIAGATNSTFTLASVTVSDVGMYAAAAMNSAGTTESKSVPLSTLATNMGGDSGNLNTPIGWFTNSGGCCGVTFDRYHVFLPFDGPVCTPASTLFPNPNNRPFLDVDTLDAANTTADTCVMVQQSFVPYGVVACNNDFAPPPLPNPRLSKCTASLANGKKYRVGVCFQSATLGNSTSIAWHYLYHN